MPNKTCTACGRAITPENPAWVGCGPEEIIYCKHCSTVKNYATQKLRPALECNWCRAPLGLVSIAEGNLEFCSTNCKANWKLKQEQIERQFPTKQQAPTQHDPVNHPAHYTSHPSGVECIQITRHMNFNRGNAMKYIWRCGDKGKPIEDLQKAIWYLQDEIKRLEQQS